MIPAAARGHGGDSARVTVPKGGIRKPTRCWPATGCSTVGSGAPVATRASLWPGAATARAGHADARGSFLRQRLVGVELDRAC